MDLGKNYKNISISLTNLIGKTIQSKIYNNSQLLDLEFDETRGIYLIMI